MLARRSFIIAALMVLTLGMSSCSWVSGWFGDDDEIPSESITVFDATVGDCFLAPGEIRAELADLNRVDCELPHQQELYAVVEYETPGDSDDYPGNAPLDRFAQGICAEHYAGYVGIAYPDSGLWMTYLLPSARSWNQGSDRSILCFVTTTEGGELLGSVKDSKQ